MIRYYLLFSWFLSLLCINGFTEEHSLWNDASTYTIAEQTDGSLIKLDDGSEWIAGYFWEYTVAKWEKGDKIQIAVPNDLAYYFYKIDNLTKRETAWSRSIHKIPDPSFSGCKWVHDMEETDQGLSVKTNQGLQFTLAPSLSSTWKAGDVLTFIHTCWPDDSPAVINHTQNSLLIQRIHVQEANSALTH